MGASVVLHSSNGLATHHGKTMEWELASLGGAHSPGLGTFSAVPSGGLLLLEFPPSPTPYNLEVAIKTPLEGACQGQAVMARMGSVDCYESCSVPYHPQMPGGEEWGGAVKCQVVLRLEWGRRLMKCSARP